MFDLPKQIMLELTDSCNLDCEYCFRSSSKAKGKVMQWQAFQTIVSKLPFIETFSFCGMGEQLLHPDYYKAIEYLKHNGKNACIITNGTISIDYNCLRELGNIKSLTFSVDGTTEEIIHKVCSKYYMVNLMENLRIGMKYPDIFKEVNFVLNENNISDAVNMVDFCNKNGIHKLNILLPSYSLDWIKNNLTEIVCILEQIEKMANEKNVIYSSPYNQYCFYKETPIPFISLNGNIRACCDHFNRIPIIGNIIRDDYLELFNGNRYRNFNSGKYCESCKMYKALPRL